MLTNMPWNQFGLGMTAEGLAIAEMGRRVSERRLMRGIIFIMTAAIQDISRM